MGNGTGNQLLVFCGLQLLQLGWGGGAIGGFRAGEAAEAIGAKASIDG